MAHNLPPDDRRCQELFWVIPHARSASFVLKQAGCLQLAKVAPRNDDQCGKERNRHLPVTVSGFFACIDGRSRQRFET